MVHRSLRGAKAAILSVLAGALVCACGTVTTPVGTFGDRPSADAAALDPDADRLAFLAPFFGAPWYGVVGEGEAALAVRLAIEPVVAGRMARVVTHVRVDEAWTIAIVGHLGWDPTIERVRYRAWSTDGAYFDGVAESIDGELGLLYDVVSPAGSARFERRYAVDGGATCTRRTRRVDDGEPGPWTQDQVLRRAVPAAAPPGGDGAP